MHLSLPVESAIALALVTHLVWSWCRPSECVGRLSRWLMAANAAAWIAFMLTPPVPAEVFAAIDEQRRIRPEGMGTDLFHHRPTHLAGRYAGIGGSMNGADRVLNVFAGPAIDFGRAVHLHLVPRRYVLTEPTRGESYAIAAVAFVLSMAFWNAFGATVQFWRTRRRRRAKVLDPPSSIPAP